MATIALGACNSGQPQGDDVILLPASSAELETVTGMPGDAVLSVGPIDDNDIVLFFANRVETAQLNAAPGRVCRSQGRTVVSSRIADLEHPGQLPGVKKLIVTCG